MYCTSTHVTYHETVSHFPRRSSRKKRAKKHNHLSAYKYEYIMSSTQETHLLIFFINSLFLIKRVLLVLIQEAVYVFVSDNSLIYLLFFD